MTKKIPLSPAQLQLQAILENKLYFDPEKLALHLNRSNLEEPFDDEGNTPLMYAVKHNQRQLVRFLLGMGANPEKVFALVDGLEDKQIYWYLRNYQKTDQQLLKMIHIHRDAIHAYIPQVKAKGGSFIKIFQAIVDEIKTQDLTTLNLYEKYDLYFTVSQLARMAVHSADDLELAENLTQFFAKREALIQNTSMDYCFGDSIANRICGKVVQIDESKSNIYETLFKHRKTAERKEEWQQWRRDLESTDELPTNPELLFAWQPKTSGTQSKYGELHLWDTIAGTAIMALKKVENEYEHVWKKTDPKYRRIAKDSDYKPEPLPPIALAILRQKGSHCQELVDYYLQISSAMADEKSITGNFAKLRKELRTNNYQRDINQYEFAELNAGEDVYAAIPNFFIWFEGLPENVRTPLSKLNAQTDGGHFSILELINLLRDYIETDRSKHKFCIYSINEFLFAVLQANPVRLAKIQLILNPHSKPQLRKSNQELAALYEAILLELKKPSSTPILINNGASRLGEFIQQYLDRQILMDNPGEAFFTEFIQVETPLNLAIEQGDSKKITSLVEDGGDIYRQNFQGENAIDVAKKIQRLDLLGENITIIDKIIKNQNKNLLAEIAEQCSGAHKNRINFYLGLNEVIEKNNFVKIEELLETAPGLFTEPPQFAEFKGETLLTYVLTKRTRGSSERNTNIEYLIEFLLEQPVDPLKKNSHNQNLFDLACQLKIHNRPVFVEAAQKYLHLAQKQGQEHSLQQILAERAYIAARDGDVTQLQTIIDCYPEVIHKTYDDGISLIVLAFHNNQNAIKNLLFASGVVLTDTILDLMVQRKILLDPSDFERRLFSNLPDSKQNNLRDEFRQVLTSNNLDRLKKLIHILPTEIALADGETPLTFALKNNANPAMLKLLFSKFDPFIRNQKGESPISLSLELKTPISDFDSDYFYLKLEKKFKNSIICGNLEECEMLLSICPNLINKNLVFLSEINPLIVALQFPQDAIINLLVNKGARLTNYIYENIFTFIYDNIYIEKINLLKQFELACLYSNVPVLKRILICPDFEEKYNKYFKPSKNFLYTILKYVNKNGEDFFYRLMELKLEFNATRKESIWKVISHPDTNLYSFCFDYEREWDGIEDTKALASIQNLLALFPERRQTLATFLIKDYERENLLMRALDDEDYIKNVYRICPFSVIKEIESAGQGATFSTEFMENYLSSHIRKVVNADCKEHINIIKKIHTLRPILFTGLQIIHDHARDLPNMLVIIRALQLSIPKELTTIIYEDPRLKLYLLKAIKTADIVTVENILIFFPQLISTQLTDATQKPPRNGKPIDFAYNSIIRDFLQEKSQKRSKPLEEIRAQQEQKVCFFSNQTLEASAKRMIERNIVELQSMQSLPVIKDIVFEFKNSEHDYPQKISNIERMIQSHKIDDIAAESVIEKLAKYIKFYMQYHAQASDAEKRHTPLTVLKAVK